MNIMKIELDTRPAKDNRLESAHIRLYPETNEEMARLMWISSVFKNSKIGLSDNSGVGGQAMFSVSFHSIRVCSTPDTNKPSTPPLFSGYVHPDKLEGYNLYPVYSKLNPSQSLYRSPVPAKDIVAVFEGQPGECGVDYPGAGGLAALKIIDRCLFGLDNQLKISKSLSPIECAIDRENNLIMLAIVPHFPVTCLTKA